MYERPKRIFLISVMSVTCPSNPGEIVPYVSDTDTGIEWSAGSRPTPLNPTRGTSTSKYQPMRAAVLPGVPTGALFGEAAPALDFAFG